MRRALAVTLLTIVVVIGDVALARPSDQPIRLPMAVSHGASPQQVTVEPGDHLWKISKRHLIEVEPNSPIGPYWLEVIDANLANLRSGNPDLIFPGEIVTLPDSGY